jgi:hypothetical protein
VHPESVATLALATAERPHYSAAIHGHSMNHVEFQFHKALCLVAPTGYHIDAYETTMFHLLGYFAGTSLLGDAEFFAGIIQY